jgi:hypothetical protein
MCGTPTADPVLFDGTGPGVTPKRLDGSTTGTDPLKCDGLLTGTPPLQSADGIGTLPPAHDEGTGPGPIPAHDDPKPPPPSINPPSPRFVRGDFALLFGPRETEGRPALPLRRAGRPLCLGPISRPHGP